MNKILIVDANKLDQTKLETILEPIIQEGGEILVAEEREAALHLMDTEHPQLVFLDVALVGGDEDVWVKEGIHVILMQEKGDKAQRSEDFLTKPFKAEQVLEKCRGVLESLPAPEIPPM